MMSIRARLHLLLLAGLGAALVAGGAGVYWFARAGLTAQFDSGLEARARTIAALVTLEPGRLEFAEDDGPAVTIGETYYELHTLAGEFLKRSDNLGSTPLPLRGGLVPEAPAFGDVDLPGGARGRAVWHAFTPRVDYDEFEEEMEEDGQLAAYDIETLVPEPETVVVIAALDRSAVDRALATILAALLVVGVIVLATVTGLVAFGVGWGLAPLDRLSRQLGDVRDPLRSERFDAEAAPRELAPIHRELNRMLDRVEQTLVRERSFASAAAHELRTPLAELRAAAEVALRWPDEERAAAALSEALAIGGEMERLVEALLMISRGEALASGGRTRGTRIAAIVSDRLTRIRDADANDPAIECDVDETHRLPGHPEAMSIIIGNLIDNAVRYTPPGGRILIRSVRSDAGVELHVENEPIELTEQDVERLFDPFWRADAARTDREHVGLGLTVVRQTARALGLAVEAALEGRTLRIRLSPAS
jgi:signal transduction histidine kinase